MKTLLILLALPLQVFAQDLTGIWTGFLEMGESKLSYELVISGDKKNLSGYSLMTFTFNGVENVGLKTMEIKVKRGSIAIEDGELIYDNYNTPPRKVKLYGSLAWVGRDSNMTLAGTFQTRSLDMRALNENAFKGIIRLKKTRAFAQTNLTAKLKEMDLMKDLSFMKPAAKKTEDKTVSTKTPKEPTKESKTKSKETISPAQAKTKNVSPPKENEKQPERTIAIPVSAAEVAKRETEIIQTVVFKSDSLVISLYDNGEIDGDTVSVVLNGKIIIAKQGLTAKPVTIAIQTSGLGDSVQLVMYAENLGRIPPNSGLLILQDGIERYRIRFSGDLQTNSAIILKRKR
jgi:hypothetical protein